MRIIAGKYKGRKLTPPKDDAIRPTSDRTRESIFNLLMHGALGGKCIIDQRVADICCGTGALGLEALSRGAAHATFVDMSRQSLALAEKNAEHIGCIAQTQFMHVDATRLGNSLQPYGCILMDAPYHEPITLKTLDVLHAKGWVEKGSIIVLEHTNEPLEIDETRFDILTQRSYGKAQVSVLEVL